MRGVLKAVGGFEERFSIVRKRPARWGISLAQQRKSQFSALLYRKYPRLSRQQTQASPPWLDDGCCASLLGATAGGAAGLAWRWPLVWCGSALIPPLSVYWRLREALRFRVVFL